MSQQITLSDLIAWVDNGNDQYRGDQSYRMGFLGGTLAMILNGESTAESVRARVMKSIEGELEVRE